MGNEQNYGFDTESKWAIVSGWLVIPAIHVMITLMSSILIILLGSTAKLEGSALNTYIFSIFIFIYIGFTIYGWVKRKRYFPILMIIFYGLQAIESFIFITSGFGDEFLYLFVNLIFIVYFIRSKRVKATFVK